MRVKNGHLPGGMPGGTGVGLAIALAVAESHGGTIKSICPDGKSMTIKVVI